MIPKIFVIMAWIMVIGGQAESRVNPDAKFDPSLYISEKGYKMARALALKRECWVKMGNCANSCPDTKMDGKKEIEKQEDRCTFLDNLKKGCLSSCPSCVQEKLKKFAEIGRQEGCDFIVGNKNTLCAMEAMIMNLEDCERAAKEYGKDFKAFKLGDPTGYRNLGGCSMIEHSNTIVFNLMNMVLIQEDIAPICRREETLEKKAKDEMLKELAQTISTAKENKAQIDYLISKVKTVVDLEPSECNSDDQCTEEGFCNTDDGKCVPIPKEFPGCWIRYPSGCPNQKSRAKYNSLQKKFTWNRDNFRGASDSREKCFAREGPLNNWCGVDDIVVVYV